MQTHPGVVTGSLRRRQGGVGVGRGGPVRLHVWVTSRPTPLPYHIFRRLDMTYTVEAINRPYGASQSIP